MTPDLDFERINELIGEAIGEMIKSGALAGAVGAFARSYPAVVDRILGAQAKPAELDVAKIIEATVIRTIELTVKSGLAKPRSASGGWVDVEKVNLVIGAKRTSATIPKSLLRSLDDLAGSRVEAKKIMESAAMEMPKDVSNRSAWLVQRLSSYALATDSQRAAAQAH